MGIVWFIALLAVVSVMTARPADIERQKAKLAKYNWVFNTITATIVALFLFW